MGAIESPVQLQRHRVTVENYHLMAEVGILAPDARVELIDGEVIDMAPMKSRHAWVVSELYERLTEQAAKQFNFRSQTPLHLSPHSEPEPDLMVLRRREDGYKASHPEASDVLLLIEVSDTTLGYDLRVKLPLYARHGVPEVWIVDLENHRLRVFRKPVDDDYTEAWALDGTEAAEALAPAAAPGLTIQLSGLLG
jgi:Uma2 family endonuclease